MRAVIDNKVQRICARTKFGVGIAIGVCSRGCIGEIVPRIVVACCDEMAVVGGMVDGEMESRNAVAS